jgi:phosphoglycolate phosphatase (TIGR01487 family)
MIGGFDLGRRRFTALATDYDGTLAHDGIVREATFDALKRFKARGGTAILATGRVLPELQQLFAGLPEFNLVVAENGGVLYWPASGEIRALAPPPPQDFVEELQRRGVGPVSVGHCIVATWTPHEIAVLETIKDMQLGLSIIFNKNAVMILPTGVDKASGVKAAFTALGLKPSETIGVGDAENDVPFLKLCGLGVAVANALDVVKQSADLTTKGARGEGVAEVLDSLPSGAG